MSITDAERSVLGWAKKKGIGASMERRDPHAEPSGLINDPHKLEGLDASTDILVKDIADILVKKFPGFHWIVQPSQIGKVFNIFIADFNTRYGYRIKYTDIMNDPKRRIVVQAAREMLKRFHYPGVKYDVLACAAVPRNLRGEAIPYLGDKKASRDRKIAELELALATGKARVAANLGNGQESGQIIVVEK